MVGDRIYTDMAMARAAGVLGVLVLSGEATAADAAAARGAAGPGGRRRRRTWGRA